MKKAKEIITGFFIVGLFCIVASDGEWFPWANLAALGILAVLVEVFSLRRGRVGR